MSIETEIAALTLATNNLLAAVNVSKASLDSSIAAAAATATGAAQTAALASGAYPTSATTVVPTGLKGYTNIVGGSGGTNGTFALAISGGGGNNASGTFTVAGGALTSISITTPGYGYTSAPTLSFAASAGLTGASATAVIGAIVAAGQFYWALANDGLSLVLYQNNNGSPSIVTPSTSISTKTAVDAIPAAAAAIARAWATTAQGIDVDGTNYPGLKSARSYALDAVAARDAALSASSQLSVSVDENKLIVFVDGSPDQMELGSFLEDGTFSPNKWPTPIRNVLVRYSEEVTDNSGDLFQILDNSEDGVYLLRIASDGKIYGSFSGVDNTAVNTAISNAQTALNKANEALSRVEGTSRDDLLRTLALRSYHSNRFTIAPMTSAPAMQVTAGDSAPSDLTRAYNGSSSVFQYLGGEPIGGDNVGVHAVSYPSSGNLGGGRSALHWAVKFETDAPKIALRVNSDQTSGYFTLWVNDQKALDSQQIDGSANGFHLINIDFGSRANRVIRFDCTGNTRFGGVYVGNNDTVWPISKTDVVRAVWIADSFGEGFSSRGGNFPTYTPGVNWPFVAGAYLGWDNVRQACIGGTGYLYDGGAGNNKWNFNAHKNDWLTFNPDILVFAGSVNNGGLDVNAEADQALQTWIDARAGLPNVPIVIMGLMSDSAYTGLVSTQENLLAQRFATWADSNSVFIPIATDPEGPWVRGGGTMAAPNGQGNADIYKGTSITADRTHLNPNGDLYAGKRSASKIRAWLINR